jgi:AmmeMemoRadiSam system protein A
VNISKIARQSIQDEFDYTNSIDTEKLIKENPALVEDGASFVTLTQNGKLRGCIGSLEARRPLIEDIIANAKSAAFRDPRFSKLPREELHVTDIEVSILTKPELLEYCDIEDLKAKIRPNIDGVILKLKSNQATFLPQVWEELPEFESFFGHLLNKAGLPMDSFKNHPKIYTYRATKYK